MISLSHGASGGEMNPIALILLLISGAVAAEPWPYSWKRPRDFPEGCGLKITRFQNWANDITKQNVYTAYPKTPEDVVKIVNWARKENYSARASGAMHTWAPITIKGVQRSRRGQPNSRNVFFDREEPGNVILLKTRHLNRMRILSSKPTNASFWAEPGIYMDELLETLERSKLGFLGLPAPGDITLGGALAIGAHGTGVRAKDEVMPPGHTYGSMSNLIMEFTAVVYSEREDRYVLKTFHRFQEESSAFLVNVGRAFITNVTMRVGPLTYLRCQSFTNIPAKELFRNPDEASPDDRTIAYWLDKTGRMEVILFPFTEFPWLKVWTIAPEQPKSSRKVTRPYNYIFSDNIPRPIAFLVGEIQKQPFLAPIVGLVEFEFIQAALITTRTTDLWGPSRTVLNYIRPTTLLVTANGYAIHTKRETVQRVIFESYEIYRELMLEFKANGTYPINGPLEMRVTGVDEPGDVLIPGAKGSGFSATTPSGVPGFDTVVWLDVLTYSLTNGIYQYMHHLEELLYERFNDKEYALMRVEWSKGWAYNVSASAPWANADILQTKIPKGIPSWYDSVDVLNKYDPQGVYMNEFLSNMFLYDKVVENGSTYFKKAENYLRP